MQYINLSQGDAHAFILIHFWCYHLRLQKKITLKMNWVSLHPMAFKHQQILLTWQKKYKQHWFVISAFGRLSACSTVNLYPISYSRSMEKILHEKKILHIPMRMVLLGSSIVGWSWLTVFRSAAVLTTLLAMLSCSVSSVNMQKGNKSTIFSAMSTKWPAFSFE